MVQENYKTCQKLTKRTYKCKICDAAMTRYATDPAQTWCWQFSDTLQHTFCVDEVVSWHDYGGLILLHSNPLSCVPMKLPSGYPINLIIQSGGYRICSTDTSYDPLFVQCGNVRCYWRWIIPNCRIITRYSQYYHHWRFCLCIGEEWGQIVTTSHCMCNKPMIKCKLSKYVL